jgi:hypothetical protein
VGHQPQPAQGHRRIPRTQSQASQHRPYTGHLGHRLTTARTTLQAAADTKSGTRPPDQVPAGLHHNARIASNPSRPIRTMRQAQLRGAFPGYAAGLCQQGRGLLHASPAVRDDPSWRYQTGLLLVRHQARPGGLLAAVRHQRISYRLGLSARNGRQLRMFIPGAAMYKHTAWPSACRGCNRQFHAANDAKMLRRFRSMAHVLWQFIPLNAFPEPGTQMPSQALGAVVEGREDACNALIDCVAHRLR